MKRFEFSLRRVLDVRKQQSDVEHARLQALLQTASRLLAAKLLLKQQLDDARTSLRQVPASGEDLRIFAEYERHIHHRCAGLDRDSQLVHQQVRDQQAKVRDADRQVKLLQNLKAQKLAEWTVQHDKELEELASDSHLSRMLADRRRESR